MSSCTRKTFTKRSLKEGQLLEYIDTTTNKTDRYLVVGCCSYSGGNFIVNKFTLINNKGNVVEVSDLNNNLSNKNMILSKVYSNLAHAKISNEKDISLMDISLRKLLFDNNVIYMSRKEVVQMLAKQIRKNVIII